jgi:hypothetical protein
MTDREIDPIIGEWVTTGYSASPELSMLKALSEQVEREAFRSGKRLNLKSCQTERSDGLAAFPVAFRTKLSARKQAKLRALSEALERFTWAHWWDDQCIGHHFGKVFELAFIPHTARELISHLPTPYEVREVYFVVPFAETNGYESVILMCEMSNGGFLSGGACGPVESKDETITRAAAELFRHALASKRLVEMKIAPKGFYQERLAHFAFNPRGAQAVRERLAEKGEIFVQFPELAIDEEIPHEHSGTIYVHRCLFENQPPFIGGDVERFCI